MPLYRESVDSIIVCGLGYALRYKREILQSSTYWGIVCLCVSFTFLSGQMWNRIRNPPFAMSDPRTYQPRFVYGGSQYQLGAETYFVFCCMRHQLWNDLDQLCCRYKEESCKNEK
uniref:Uncharacterized protein n=1 Tax=Ditylenchus dipsaci TaxID=166011 RepID=A0A915DGX4_9BILA